MAKSKLNEIITLSDSSDMDEENEVICKICLMVCFFYSL